MKSYTRYTIKIKGKSKLLSIQYTLHSKRTGAESINQITTGGTYFLKSECTLQ